MHNDGSNDSTDMWKVLRQGSFLDQMHLRKVNL